MKTQTQTKHPPERERPEGTRLQTGETKVFTIEIWIPAAHDWLAVDWLDSYAVAIERCSEIVRSGLDAGVMDAQGEQVW